MSLGTGGGPLDNQDYQARVDKFAAQAAADRAARLAGYKSPLQRLLSRLRPHRQQPPVDSQGSYGTLDDPGN